jgi:hypothetical protein
MKYILALVLALALAACGDEPPPKPAAKAAPPPVAVAPKPEPKPEPPKPDPNKELAALVKRTLEMPENKLPSGAIDVTATEGRVSLWGAVATNAQKKRASQVAAKVEGVKGVDNQLKVVRGS